MILPVLRIGTRGSPLALAQTEMVRAALVKLFPDWALPGAIEVVVITTSGDKILDRPLADIGGKGLFTKEIDAALLDGKIDLAVHSVKDLPTRLPDGIRFVATLPREDPRDAYISPRFNALAKMPAGAVIGTASLRRQAQVLYRRPDLSVVSFRGNVQTRLRKLAAGEVDATLLAMAGLKRLGMAETATDIIAEEDMLPAVGQGAVGITCRTDDDRTSRRLLEITDETTMTCVAAERSLLQALDGSCRTPIAGLAKLGADHVLSVRGLVARPDGREVVKGDRSGDPEDASALGFDLGMELRRQAGSNFF
ncbi:MAG: hydroxymethylbilane synthase [Rhodospirillales bacterium]|nr:hydroxymethylbilane synthase [Rhodospirillales bacterium]